MILEYIFKILLYITFSISLYICVDQNKHKLITIKGLFNKHLLSVSFYNFAISLFFSTCFGLYSIIVSAEKYTVDRKQYAIRFTNNWKNPFTPGLNIIIKFLHKFSYDERILFFTISFIVVLLTLIAYYLADQGDRNVIKYIVCSDYLICSFSWLKQSPAMALGVLSMIMMFKKKYISSIFFLAIAVLFHESAIILLPIYLMCVGSKNKAIRYCCYSLMIFTLLFFSSATRLTFLFVGRFIPDLYEESRLYLDSSGAIAQSLNFITILKGLPFYMITIHGFLKRNTYRERIAHYDELLVISAYVSLARMLSLYMYWMERFAIYCYIPDFIFASEMIAANTNSTEAGNFDKVLTITLSIITLRYLAILFFKYGEIG